MPTPTASCANASTTGRRFDAIVLDPPKFAPTVSHAERAARAYKDINRLALQLLDPGGLLFTFSCSGGIGAELFHKIVAGAAIDAGVDGHILQTLGAAPDHAATLYLPRGRVPQGAGDRGARTRTLTPRAQASRSLTLAIAVGRRWAGAPCMVSPA